MQHGPIALEKSTVSSLICGKCPHIWTQTQQVGEENAGFFMEEWDMKMGEGGKYNWLWES